MSEAQKCKTINSRDSLVVTHPTTSLPAYGFSTAERTGSPVFHTLWSIAKDNAECLVYIRTLSSCKELSWRSQRAHCTFHFQRRDAMFALQSLSYHHN